MKTKEEMLNYIHENLHNYSHGKIKLVNILEGYRNAENSIGVLSSGQFVIWLDSKPEPFLPYMLFLKFSWNFHKDSLKNQSLSTITGIYELFGGER